MKKIFIYCFLVVLFFSCKKSKTTENTANSTPTGSITGKVTQLDQYGIVSSNSLNNVTVSLIGTNISTISDASGNYTLSNVPAGMYTLKTEKPGCRPYQIQQINFPGNGTMYKDTYTFDIPTFSFNSAYIKDSMQFSIRKLFININLNPINKEVGYFIIASKTGVPDINDASTFTTPFIPMSILPNTSNYNYFYPPITESGTYYLKVYPYVLNKGSNYPQYFDYNSNKYVYVGQGNPIPQTYTLVIQ